MTVKSPDTTSSIDIAKLVLNPRKLFEFAISTGLMRGERSARSAPPSEVDTGYIVHAALAALFDKQAPRPFYIEPERKTSQGEIAGITVLGYFDSQKDILSESLRERNTFAQEILRWDMSASKRMPTQFDVGTRLRVDVRMCPVVRTTTFRNNRTDKSEELDAFLATYNYQSKNSIDPEENKKLEPIDRFTVYQSWALERLSRNGMDIESLSINGFQLTQVSRRNKERAFRSAQRPAIEVSATVSVNNPESFAAAIRLGIGRHKAFGFGMLRLSPAT